VYPALFLASSPQQSLLLTLQLRMGFIPVFLAISSLLFLWGGVIVQSLRRLRKEARAALEARNLAFAGTDQATGLARMPTDELLDQARAGILPDRIWQTEIVYRRKLASYHTLIAQSPYDLMARLLGFRRLSETGR
jgi:hypothetical protein